MIFLALTILFTVLLFILFKEFSKRNININQAITFNYITAALLAYILKDNYYEFEEILYEKWLIPTIGLGVFFIIMFNIMALTTKKLGISIASTASKMSLIIPVIASIIILNNSIDIFKVFGIIIALLAVYLTFKKKSNNNDNKLSIAIILFIGAGLLDMILDLIRNKYLSSANEFNQFITIVFLSAFLTGTIKIIYDSKKIHAKNIIAGIILGIPNYFSMYFVLIALEQLGGIYVFPVLNIGVVLTSAIISWIFYKENMSKTNWIGITLACISILIIA